MRLIRSPHLRSMSDLLMLLKRHPSREAAATNAALVRQYRMHELHVSKQVGLLVEGDATKLARRPRALLVRHNKTANSVSKMKRKRGRSRTNKEGTRNMMNLPGDASYPRVAPYGACVQRPSCSIRTETQVAYLPTSSRRQMKPAAFVVGRGAGCRYCCRCS